MEHAVQYRTISSPSFYCEPAVELDESREEGFKKTFLNANDRYYPGLVTNLELLVDKESVHFNSSNKDSYMNYNLIEGLEAGKDFILVPKTIFSYFGNVYGGFDIKRYAFEAGYEGSAVETKLLTVY